MVGHRLEALFVTALGARLHISEALGFSWDGIDLTRGFSTAHSQLQQLDGQLVLTESKSRCDRRALFLRAMAVNVLKERRRRQVEASLQADTWDDPG